MRYLWRCTRQRCNQLPYFGFVTTRTAAKPSASECKWLDVGCPHNFRPQLSQKELPYSMFFEKIAQYFDEQNIVIISKYIGLRGFHSSHENVSELGSFVEPSVSVEEIADERFLNYHPTKRLLIEPEAFRGKFTDWMLGHVVVCMLCEQSIPKNCVIGHLEKCFGLAFECSDPLPAYKFIL